MKQKYLLYALIPVFFWSLGSVVIRLTFGSLTIINFTAFRSWLGAITLISACLIKRTPLPKKRDIPLFLIAGVVGFAIYTIFFNTGLMFVTAATGNVIMAAVPVFTAVIALITFKERIKLLGWVSIGISFSGVLILLLWNGVLSINVGVLWLIAAAFLNSIYNLIQRKLTRTYSALEGSAYSLIAGAVALSPFLPGAVRELVVAPPVVIAVVLFTGFCSAGLGYLFWTKALAIADRTASVTNLLYLPPFLSAILAYMLFSELPDWGTAVGGVIILAGLWMFQKKA